MDRKDETPTNSPSKKKPRKKAKGRQLRMMSAETIFEEEDSSSPPVMTHYKNSSVFRSHTNESTKSDILRTKKSKPTSRTMRVKKTRRDLERSTSTGNIDDLHIIEDPNPLFVPEKKSSGSRIRLNFSKPKSKSIDPDSFIPINTGKERKRKQSAELLKEDAEPTRVPALITLSTRHKMDLMRQEPQQLPEGACNSRLSINLAADAASLYYRLSVRPALDIVQPLIKEPVIQPYTVAKWTSTVRIDDDWEPVDHAAENGTPLIDRACLESGYNIEIPRKKERGEDPEGFSLEDSEKDIKFFAQLCESATEIIHFVGVKEQNNSITDVTIISLENDKNKKFQRVILRTPSGDDRFLIPTTSSTNKALKILYNQCPLLAETKLQRIRRDDTAALTKVLLETEEKLIECSYKFGVLYAGKGQTTDDEFFNNVDAPQEMMEFIQSVADRIELKGWTQFRGGLDVKSETTGSHSYYTRHRGCEIMFHVSTLIPFYPKDAQQVERKRHLGNDIVLIIFKDGEDPIDPTCIHSQYNHVFVVVSAVKILNKTYYRVEWCAKPGVPPFKPYDIAPGMYESGPEFRDRFLTKLLNAQRAAMYAKSFRQKMSRTRLMLYKAMYTDFQK